MVSPSKLLITEDIIIGDPVSYVFVNPNYMFSLCNKGQSDFFGELASRASELANQQMIITLVADMPVSQLEKIILVIFMPVFQPAIIDTRVLQAKDN